MSNEAMLDELDEAFRDVYPGRGRVPMLLHDDELDGYRSGKTEAGELPLPRCELRTDLPNPFAVLVEGGNAAAAAEVARYVEAFTAAVEEAARRLAPVFEAVAANIRAAAAHCEAVGLLPPPPLDVREQALAAKRAPGRTGPPAPRMDGRCAR